MRHIVIFCVVFLLMAFMSIFCTYMAETYDAMQLRNKYLPVTFTTQGEDLVMSWTPFPYPCVYKVYSMTETTGLVQNSPRYHLLTSAETSTPEYTLPRTPIPTYYLISARGIFKEIFRSSVVAANPNFPLPPRPISIFKYNSTNPASLMPFLVWHTVPNAVCYEVELLSAPPEVEGGIAPSKNYHLETMTKVFTNGCQADLRPYYQTHSVIYWRARALGLHREPIGEFNTAEPIYFDENLPLPNCPLINNFDFMEFEPLPVYPVYNWIPINDAAKYEVELLAHPPEIENDVEPSIDSLWRQTTVDMSSCYDEYSRPYAGPYYWRVRALDENNNPIGTWSNSEKFIVEDFTKGVNTAIFGDSISHGGGAVSYSPRALEYSYATYIDFPVLNLSRSGDTSHTAVERFERDVLPFKPRNLIILAGTNSLRDENISAVDIINDLAQIQSLCNTHNIRPILLTLMPINPDNIAYAFHTETDPHWHDKLVTVNNFIKQQEFYIDIEPYFYDADGNMDRRFSIDGIHPDLRGKMLMGEIINQYKNLFIGVNSK